MYILFIALTILHLHARFHLPYLEQRPEAVSIPDKLLDILPVADMSNVICLLTVAVPALVTYQHFFDGRGVADVELFWLEYALCILIKTFTTFLLPLNVPKGYIPLTDPATHLFSRSETIFGKDLFFSGHTVLMYLCCLHVTWYKLLVYSSMVVLPVLLMINRVHYTIDIAIAPFIGYACHRFVQEFVA